MKLSLLTCVAITLLVAASLNPVALGQTAEEGPRVLAAVAPGTYPPIALATRAEGEVIIEGQIDAAGAVISTKMVSGHQFLQRVSEEAAKQWRFVPSLGLNKVLLRCELPDGFSIEDEPMSGFHTTRFVDAGSDVAAGEAAIEALRREAKFMALRTQLSSDPVITAEAVEPEEKRRADAPRHGYAFYGDE